MQEQMGDTGVNAMKHIDAALNELNEPEKYAREHQEMK